MVYKIQSILFSTKKYNIDKAIEFLKEHNYKFNDIDIKTENYIRFRQLNPKKLEKEGYKFINKKINKYIILVLAYPPTEEGGAISSKNLSKFYGSSYKPEGDDKIDDYILDKSLSNETTKVYYNPDTKRAVVVHRGTKSTSLSDWGNNVAYVFGQYKKTNRYKNAEEIQKLAEEKYGSKNISTLGHSQGSVLARELGKNTKEIININPAYLGEHVGDNEYNIKTSGDFASTLLKPVNSIKNWFGMKSNKNKIVDIPSETYNPVAEHSWKTIDRLDPDLMIGESESHLEGGAVFVSRDKLKDILQQYKKMGFRVRLTTTKPNLIKQIILINKELTRNK